MLTLSVAIAVAQLGIVRRLRAGPSHVKRWGGYVLIAVGVWLLVLAVWAAFFARVFPV